MRPLSHALFLVLKLSTFEAKHGQAKTVTKDHLFLGLLKVVDVDLRDYIEQLSKPEQTATLEEVEELRKALCIIDTTRTRRAMRKLLAPNLDPDAAMTATPGASTGFAEALAKLGSEALPGACLSLLKILLEYPGKGTTAQLKTEGAKAELILSTLPSPDGPQPETSLAQSVLEMHKQWGKQSGGKQPDLSECWRRLAVGTVVEFDARSGLRLLQANHCLVHIPSGKAKAREEIFGPSLAAAFAEFESGADQKPCRVPLAEF
jgi:hypothetical protein